MALLTATEIREHVDTDLGDTALDRLLADADAEIVRRYGAHTANQVETFTPPPGSVTLQVDRPISSIVSIVETEETDIGESDVTLAASDYEIMRERTIRRVSGGLHSSTTWGSIVVVTYTPDSDNARRIGVTIDLVKLAVQYQAASSVAVGDVSISHVDYNRERERILRRLAPSIMGVWA